MRSFERRYWVLVPILASMAVQCDEAPRGAIPTLIARVELVLNSVPAPPPADMTAFTVCLNRMDGLPNHVRPSWRSSVEQPSGEAVLFAETAPNVWRVVFGDVPVNFLNTMTVHDTNECARDTNGQGHVTMGVTVNGTPITMVVGVGALAFELNEDGTVKPPVPPPPT